MRKKTEANQQINMDFRDDSEEQLAEALYNS